MFVHKNGSFVDKFRMDPEMDPKWTRKWPRKGLEEFLFADGGDEFLEVEGFEVCHVLEVACAEGCNCRFEHCRGFWPALAEVGVRVLDDIGTFAGAVAYEQAWTLLEIFGEACFVDDGRSGFGDLSIGRRSFAALRMT